MLHMRSDHCVWRAFGTRNESVFMAAWAYQLETGLHEMLLQSEHRCGAQPVR